MWQNNYSFNVKNQITHLRTDISILIKKTPLILIKCCKNSCSNASFTLVGMCGVIKPQNRNDKRVTFSYYVELCLELIYMIYERTYIRLLKIVS